MSILMNIRSKYDTNIGLYNQRFIDDISQLHSKNEMIHEILIIHPDRTTISREICDIKKIETVPDRNRAQWSNGQCWHFF